MNSKRMCVATHRRGNVVAGSGSRCPDGPECVRSRTISAVSCDVSSVAGRWNPAGKSGRSAAVQRRAGRPGDFHAGHAGGSGQAGQQLLDKQFVRAAVQGGLADVKLGTLAVEKGGPDVKDAAQKIVDDHTAMNKEMETVADALGVMVPKKLSKEDQAEYDKLNGLSGKDFDTEYLTYIVKAHWQTLHNFYMEATAAADPDLQADVVKDLGTMHQHLGLIATTAKAEGITLPPRPPRPGATTTANK